jgi:hypothetical protein
MTVTREKIVALFAVAGFLLIVSHHSRLGLVCELAVIVTTIFGIK